MNISEGEMRIKSGKDTLGKKLSQPELSAIQKTVDASKVELSQLTQPAQAMPEAIAPKAEAQLGEADAGLQQSMLPEVPAKEVRVQGKGKLTQLSMDDLQKLAEVKGKVEAGTKEEINLEIARREAEGYIGEASGDTGIIERELTDIETELGNRSMPYHGQTKSLYPGITGKSLEMQREVYLAALGEGPGTPRTEGVFESLAKETAETAPPEPPEVPPGAVGLTPEPSEIPTRPTLPDIQDAKTILDINLKPDRKRTLAQLPGIKQALSHFNPSAVANTPAEKFRVIRSVGRDQGNQRTQITMSYLYKMGDSSKVFGKMDKTGIISEGAFKGKSINELAENIKKYEKDLSPDQREWLDRANDTQKAILEFAEKHEIVIEELGLAPGQRFASRKVLGKLDEQGDLVEVAYLGAGPGRIGGKISAQKHRSYASIEEAQKDGFRYLSYDQALEATVRSIYNAASNKMAADWLLTQVPWRTTGAPEELILKAEGAKVRTQASSKLLAGLNRAVRGERLPGSTIEAIRRVYPSEAKALEELIPRLQAGEETATDVKILTAKAKLLHDIDLKELKEAINTRARAREKAITPNYGEAMLMHPAFAGKVFTGPDAQETVTTLRDMLEPKHIAGLKGVNSVNGLIRYFKLAGDASVLGIQLLIGAFDNPKAYAMGAEAYIKALFSEEFHANLLNNARDVLERHPDLITTLSGTEFTEAFQRSGLFQKGILKVGGVVLGPFQRGFEASIDAAGIEMAKALEHTAKSPADIQAIDQYINEMRGLTSSARLGVSPNWQAAETLAMLAPRYNRAIASYLADAFEGFVKTGHAGIRARKARNSLLKFTAGITGLWIALGLALGKDWDEVKDSIGDGLFTYNIGGTNIGPGTKIRSVIKLIKDSAGDPEGLIQSSMDNPGLRFIRGNLSPVLGSSLDILTGKNYIGEPVRDNFSNFNRHILTGNFLPIWVENVLYEGGSVSQRVVRGTGEFFGGRTYPETDFQTTNTWRERYAALDYGKKYEDLNKAERGELTRTHPDLEQLEEETRKGFAETGNAVERFYQTEKDSLQTLRNDRLNQAAQSLIRDDITKYDYDKERSYIRPYYSGGNNVLYSMRESNMSSYEQKKMEAYLESRKPEDIALSGYQEFYGETIEKADLPKDWDLIDEEVNNFLERYPENISTYILEHKDDWIKDLPPAARQVEEMRAKGIEDESWWDDYRGSTTIPNLLKSRTLGEIPNLLKTRR